MLLSTIIWNFLIALFVVYTIYLTVTNNGVAIIFYFIICMIIIGYIGKENKSREINYTSYSKNFYIGDNEKN